MSNRSFTDDIKTVTPLLRKHWNPYQWAFTMLKSKYTQERVLAVLMSINNDMGDGTFMDLNVGQFWGIATNRLKNNSSRISDIEKNIIGEVVQNLFRNAPVQ